MSPAVTAGRWWPIGAPATLSGLAVAASALWPVLAMGEDAAGWVLLYLSFVLVLASRHVRVDARLVLAVWLTLLAHHAVALVNAYGVTVTGAEYDAATFHWKAADRALVGRWDFMIGTMFYESVLGLWYAVVGPSLLAGEELSIVAYCLAVVALVRLLHRFDHRPAGWPLLVILFGMTPAMLIHGSVTLRESWELLFFMLAAIGLLGYTQTQRAATLMAALAAALVMGMFHAGLMAYAIVMSVAVVAWVHLVRAQINWRMLGLVVLGIGAVATAWVMFAGVEIERIAPLRAAGGLLDDIVAYRDRLALAAARSGYAVEFDPGTVVGILVGFTRMYLHYQFGPFPWEVGAWRDLYGVGEAAVRTLLLVLAVWYWRRSTGTKRRQAGLLLALYFPMTLLWAVGTADYGTALRHHLLTNWILVLLGGPVLVELWRRRRDRWAGR